jgi:hypothetical protein
MQEAPPRAPLSGPTFIRLLARLTDADVQPPGQTLSERLGQWIDWTHAVALSRALDGSPAVPDPAADPDADACARARGVVAGAIAAHRDWAAGLDDGSDYGACRERYLVLQRSMLAATGRLRDELRDALARRSPALARLAEVDALMERVLSPREHALLGTVPDLLGQHFARLRQAASLPDTAGAPASTSSPWLEVFRRDMHSVLLAELDLRFQPVEALRAALHTS